MFNFDEANKTGKQAMDAALKSYSDVAKSVQAIAAETAEYSKKSMQDNVAHFEALSGAKTIETALELQTGFAKAAYEGFVAEATKLTEMYTDLAKIAYKPYEASIAKATSAG